VEPTVGLAIAFTAGVLSFLSPCVLPLIPSYLTFITGMAFEDVTRSRRATLVHALLFVLGFSLIFVALGATATALGNLLLGYRDVISRVGGVLVIVFGLYMLGVLRIGAFARDTRAHLSRKPVGYVGSVVVGVAFGAGWTPCIGPILGAILTYASMSGNLARGTALLSSYSLGLAVPFLLSAVAIERFLAAFQRLRRHLALVNRISGVLLVVVGVLMLTNWFTVLAGYLDVFTPDALRARL
jgi:cytochrome c-type biogenesis protein